MKSHSWLVNFVGFGNNLDYSSSENGAFIIKKGFDGPFAKGKGVWFVTGYGVFDGPSIARLPFFLLLDGANVSQPEYA